MVAQSTTNKQQINMNVHNEQDHENVQKHVQYTNLCITVECRMHIEVHENENKHVSVHAQCKCWYGGCGR